MLSVKLLEADTPTPTDKRQVNTYGNLACLRGMAGSEHKKATSYSISGEQKQNHRMFMLNGWKPKANRRQATDEHDYLMGK